MTVVLRHHREYELNFVEYSGAVTPAEIVALADFQAGQPTLLTYDLFGVVAADADLRAIELSKLDAMYARYRDIFRPLNLVILRRVAWVCESPAARTHLQHWLREPEIGKAFASDIRVFDTRAEAATWLVIDPAKAAAVVRGEGFVELARFCQPAAGPAR
ncbi:MAG: hypothetical protein K2P58_01375 [Hyphomonadaceae bacterium]|nr:hypothetical protein [Hyphomonadaceae bacterium]